MHIDRVQPVGQLELHAQNRLLYTYFDRLTIINGSLVIGIAPAIPRRVFRADREGSQA